MLANRSVMLMIKMFFYLLIIFSVFVPAGSEGPPPPPAGDAELLTKTLGGGGVGASQPEPSPLTAAVHRGSPQRRPVNDREHVTRKGRDPEARPQRPQQKLLRARRLGGRLRCAGPRSCGQGGPEAGVRGARGTRGAHLGPRGGGIALGSGQRAARRSTRRSTHAGPGRCADAAMPGSPLHMHISFITGMVHWR